MNASWLVLNPKIKAALVALLIGDGASFLGAWNGTITWHVALGVVFGSLITTVAGYLTPAPPVAAISKK